MASSRHLVHAGVADEYVELLAQRAQAAPVGDLAGGNVALGPMIDRQQLKVAHAIVTDSVAAGARLATGGTYEGLMYRLARPRARAYVEEIFGQS